MPNVVATAANADGPIYEGAFGPKAVGKPDPVTVDTLYRIASMTKMVTTVAALQLVEQRRARPRRGGAASTGPSSRDLKVLDGWDGDEPRLRDPKTFATVRQLVDAHLGPGLLVLERGPRALGGRDGHGQLARRHRDAFTAPLVADPGTKVEYGINTDWLGLVVEAASGQKLDAYFDEHILGPLGMEQTTFHPTDQQRENLSAVHLRGEAVRAPGRPRASTGTPRPTGGPGGHGLYCPPSEYLRFQRMLLNNGTLDGTKILEAETVEDAFANQIGDLDWPGGDRHRRAARRPPTSTPARATSSASACCATRTTSRACAAPAAAPGRASSTPTSGSTATTGVTGRDLHRRRSRSSSLRCFQVYIDFEKALYASL